jgi:hypothetical protein
MRTRWLALVLSALACGCSAPPRQAPLPADGEAPAPKAQAGHTVYVIDPQASEIRALVYRAGPLARLGHNHVITWHPERGWIDAAASMPASSLLLRVALEQAVVDDARKRSEEGADFPGEIPEEARAGTAKNMLSEALLDAARHPRMIIRSSAISEKAGVYSAQLLLNIAGRDVPLRADFKMDRSADGLTASGEFKLLQSELGLKPFSVMLGALQVQDQIGVKFRLVARRS